MGVLLGPQPTANLSHALREVYTATNVVSLRASWDEFEGCEKGRKYPKWFRALRDARDRFVLPL